MTWHFHPVRVIAVGFCSAVVFSASDDVALVFLATGPLGGGEAAASLMYAGAGAGLLIGFALVAGFGGRFTMLTFILAGFAVANSGNLFTGLAWSIPAAFAMQVIRGIGISLIDVGVNTTVQRIVPPGMQGCVFANMYGFVGIAAGLSYALGGHCWALPGPVRCCCSRASGDSPRRRGWPYAFPPPCATMSVSRNVIFSPSKRNRSDLQGSIPPGTCHGQGA